jgi:hypothetical protein
MLMPQNFGVESIDAFVIAALTADPAQKQGVAQAQGFRDVHHCPPLEPDSLSPIDSQCRKCLALPKLHSCVYLTQALPPPPLPPTHHWPGRPGPRQCICGAGGSPC